MEDKNVNGRLEAFCDGVFAIALTLLIIDIKISSTQEITTSADLWKALQHLTPNIFAFLVSFIVIFITWVNHHAGLKLVNKSSTHFVYANGLLLLSVVFVPFPTSLLGEFVLTDHAAPAVVLYSGVFALQAVGWILMCRATINPAYPLARNEKGIQSTRESLIKGYYALVFYSLCSIVAFWFPLIVAIVVAISWVVWLISSIIVKLE